MENSLPKETRESHTHKFQFECSFTTCNGMCKIARRSVELIGENHERFFMGEGGEHQQTALFFMETSMFTKHSGGLGIRDLEVFNYAMLGKKLGSCY